MREVVFRGRRVDNDEWVYGSLIQMDSSGSQSFIYPFYEFASTLTCGQLVAMSMIAIDESTIGQFTGLTDKNGKRIWEGDIVHCLSRTDSGNMVVIFEDGEFRMVLCEDYANYTTSMGYYAIQCFEKEIIGTIHDKEDK